MSAVGVGCLSLLLFDMCERGIQLRNPFFSVWVSNAGAKTAVSFNRIVTNLIDYILFQILNSLKIFSKSNFS